MDAKTMEEDPTEEVIENIDKYLRSLAASSTSTNKQEKLLEKLISSEGLLEKYLRRSPDCKELFAYLDDTVEALNELSKSSVSLNINETNTEILLACLEKVLIYYQKKHKLSLITKKDEAASNQLLLVDKVDFKAKLNSVCTNLLDNYIKLVTKCLLMKSSTKKTLTLQETCVRLLTLCVQESAAYAKKIALEYECFTVFKNWLERFLLMKQTDLREYSIQFLISYFKYTKVTNSDKMRVDDVTVDHEYLILLKKIFLAKPSTQPVKSKTGKTMKTVAPANSTSSLIHCLFAHVSTDSFGAIEFLLQEFLFKFVKNESFNKSETIRIFNEKTLGQLIKLFEWTDHRYNKSNEQNSMKVPKLEDQTLMVRQMIGEFLKVLFSSTKHGISFYDRTINIDLSNKNYNHLIFNALINLPRPVTNEKDKKAVRILKEKSNEIIDEVVLKSLKVCPDLIQRFLKVKFKQETIKDLGLDQSNDLSQEWFLKFCTRLFTQQLSVLKKMRKNLCGPTSFLRSLNTAFTSVDELKSFLCDLIVHTSLPLSVSFQKLLTQIFNSKLGVREKIERYNQSLELLIVSLKCVREWQECLQTYLSDKNNMDLSDAVVVKVYDNLSKIFQSKRDNFSTNLSLELLTKHLPKFDIFCNSDLVNQILSADNEVTDDTENDLNNLVIVNSFDIFSLYFDVFMTRDKNDVATVELEDEINESDDLIGSCFNFLQIETLGQNLVRLIPALLQLGSDNLISKTNASSQNSIKLCLKYLKFLIKYLSLKQSEQCVEELTSFDMNDIESNSQLLFDSHLKIKTGDNSYKVDYKNLTILNLVKIVFKFKEQALFKDLVGFFLKLVSVYLESNEFNDYPTDTFRYERNPMYLWVLLIRKHFIDSSLSSSELNLLIDYVYFCLNNLLNSAQRNFILFQMSLNGSQQQARIGFNQLLAFISIKNYLVFNELITKNSMSLNSLKKIQAFIIDFLFGSNFIIEDNADSISKDLKQLVHQNLTNQLLYKQDCSEVVIEELKNKFDSKFKDISKKCGNSDSSSEVFMIEFETCSSLPNSSSDKNFTVVYLNLNLRISHLLFLTQLVANKTGQFSIDRDMDLIINNIRNCLEQIKQLADVEEETSLEKIDMRIYLDRIKTVCGAFKFDSDSEIVLAKLNMSLVSEFGLDKASFEKLMSEIESPTGLEKTKIMSDEAIRKFEFIAKILVKNQEFLFETETNLFKEFDLDQKFIDSLDLLSKCVDLLLSYAATFDFSKNFLAVKDLELKSKLISFLLTAYDYNPTLFKLQVKVVCSQNEKSIKYLKKFSSTNERLTSLFTSSLETSDNKGQQSPTSLTEAENQFLALNSIDERFKKELNIKRIEELVDMYTYTLSKKDKTILKRLYKVDPKLDSLLFKLKSSDSGQNENLELQPKISDFISTKLNEKSLVTACQNFPIERKLEELSEHSLTLEQDTFDLEALALNNDVLDAQIYDPIYLLPNIYNLLDYGNVVDVVQFVNSRCLSYLFAALSSECKNLRSLAYGSLYRFATHLENTRVFFKNVIVYLINLLRNSTDKENLHLPVVISVFLSEAVMIIKEPGTTLYKPIISFILLKPALDLTNVPEYYKLFNSSAINYKLERKWILGVLLYSCRTSLDFRLFEKRFIYRQLLAIYDSKISDLDTKTSILNIILRTCSCKYALIELVKRHYLLVWLSNVLEGNLGKTNTNEINLKLFYKLIQIFILIWTQLGSNRVIKNEATAAEELLPPPLTFLNQMFILMNSILEKLIKNHTRPNVLTLEVETNEADKLSLNLDKYLIKNFFKVKKELTERIQTYKLDLIEFESNKPMSMELEELMTTEGSTFSDVTRILETRKRACHDLFDKVQFAKKMKNN